MTKNSLSELAKQITQESESSKAQGKALITSEVQKLTSSLKDLSIVELNTIWNGIGEMMQQRAQAMSSDIEMIQTNMSNQIVKNATDNMLTVNLRHQQMLASIAKKNVSTIEEVDQISTAVSKSSSEIMKASKAVEPMNKRLTEANAQIEKLSKLSTKAWLLPPLISLFTFAIICLSAWGLVQYLTTQVQSNLALISQQESTIKQLIDQTFGITLQKSGTDRYVTFPPGTTPTAGFNSGDRPAVKF